MRYNRRDFLKTAATLAGGIILNPLEIIAQEREIPTGQINRNFLVTEFPFDGDKKRLMDYQKNSGAIIFIKGNKVYNLKYDKSLEECEQYNLLIDYASQNLRNSKWVIRNELLPVENFLYVLENEKK